MFPRAKKSGHYTYLQVVENRWEDGRVRQQVIASLGRLDRLLASGALNTLTRGLARFCNEVEVVDALRVGEVLSTAVRKIGPALVFARLWTGFGMEAVIREALRERHVGFSVERAVFLTVLHRLFASGSDRAAEKWKADYAIAGVDRLERHQLYRAMAWLGTPLKKTAQDGATPFSPRCVKDELEEALFLRRRDLLTELDVVFFDTTSIYFEGEGGDTLGRYGKSKDHRADLKQMVVGMVLDGQGRPVCCELWPGNTTDVKTLLPIVARLRMRFAIGAVCVVADRGMISQNTLARLEELEGITYILGARMRRQKEVKEDVLKRGGRYQEVYPHSDDPKDTALKYKQLWMVEQIFRTTKSILDTRPIYHKCDETIRGHVFCSFLALLLKTELFERLELRQQRYEWDDIRQDLEALQETELEVKGQRWWVRTPLRGACNDVFRAVGAPIPPTVRH